MSLGTIPVALTVPNDQPWSEDFRYWLDTAKTLPATISSANAFLAPKISSPLQSTFPMNVLNDRMTISGGIVGIRVTLGEMATIPPGSYTLELQTTDSSGYTRQIRGDVKIISGMG